MTPSPKDSQNQADPLSQSSLNVRQHCRELPFMPGTQLRQLLHQSEAQLVGCVLSLPDGRRYALQDAVRILGTARLETDPYGLTGVVLTVRQLLQRGFSLNVHQVALGRTLYDVEQGFLTQPLGNADTLAS